MQTARLLLLLPLLLLHANPCASQTTTSSPASEAVEKLTLGVVVPSAIDGASLQTALDDLLKAACPTNTSVQLSIISVNRVPTVDELELARQNMMAENFVFLGVYNFSLSPLLGALNIGTNISALPTMETTVFGPIPPHVLNKAIIKVLDYRISQGIYPSNEKNKQAAFILSNDVDVMEMSELFQHFTMGSVYYRFQKDRLESILLSIKNAGFINIIAIINSEEGDALKVAAFAVNMFSYQYRWIFHGPRLINTALDPRMFTYSTNITSIEFGRVTDALSKNLRTTDQVLIYDLITWWLPYLDNYLCDRSKDINEIKVGLSGKAQLNSNRTVSRINWQLQIYSGLEGQKKHVGHWDSETNELTVIPLPDQLRTPEMSVTELRHNPFRIVTVIYEPFVMFNTSVASTAPLNDRLIGMYIELCKMLMHNMGITNYQFFLQPDGAFGILNQTSQAWNGVILTLLEGKADMACAPLVVDSDRSSAVAFTKTIQTLRLSILYKTPTQDALVEMFQFLQPLDVYVWLGILGVLLFVAVVLAVMHKIIPNRGVNLSLYNSTYFAFAEVVQGTSGALPNQVSGRIVVSFFWVFTLFLLITYIGNYAAWRTLTSLELNVTSLETLLEDKSFDFGTIKNTVTVSLFRQSTFTYMQQIYMQMTETMANGLVDNATHALAIVENGSYALISDDAQNGYFAATRCNLINTGSFYYLKAAFAFNNASEYLPLIDAALTKMAANITELERQFFDVAASAKPNCRDLSFLGLINSITPPNILPVKADALTLTNTMGIALINLVGCLFALILSAIERCFSRVLNKRSEERRMAQSAEAYAMSKRRVMRE